MCKNAFWILKILLLANADQNDSLEIRGGVYMHYENGFENLWGRYVRLLFGLEISFVRELLGQAERP